MERVWRALAGVLPKRLVYWATIRLGVKATTGEYSKQIVPDLTMLAALRRWIQYEAKAGQEQMTDV